ncbi:MAG: hypothetical protein WA728_03785 [Xanthobacteraceae bacterium]
MADTAGVGALARIEPQLATEAIANERFIRQLNELRGLKEFLFEEKAQFKEEDLDSIDLEELNNLSYSTSGRVPTADEWRTLDEKLTKLTSYLSDDLRRKIRLRELSLFFKILPIFFLAFSVVSTIAYLILPYFDLAEGSLLRIFLWLIIVSVWAISQGGLGACAFLGTSVITKTSTTSESTARENVDLTDRNFLIIRVILGTLFAVLLGLPFSPLGLNVFIPLYWNHEVFPSQSNLVFSLIPFLAGFSTNPVLVILGKFVVAIEADFGLSGRT